MCNPLRLLRLCLACFVFVPVLSANIIPVNTDDGKSKLDGNCSIREAIEARCRGICPLSVPGYGFSASPWPVAFACCSAFARAVISFLTSHSGL